MVTVAHDNLTEIAFADDETDSYESIFSVTAGETYYLHWGLLVKQWL